MLRRVFSIFLMSVPVCVLGNNCDDLGRSGIRHYISSEEFLMRGVGNSKITLRGLVANEIEYCPKAESQEICPGQSDWYSYEDFVKLRAAYEPVLCSYKYVRLNKNGESQSGIVFYTGE